MTITDFEQNISAEILERGHDYFLSQLVDGLEKVAPGLWMAQVHGSEIYMVQVNTSRTNIKSWECNCPYDHGPICKHIVAVFYAIAEEMGAKKPHSAKKKKSSKSSIQDIFSKTTKEELQAFIINQFNTHKGLKNALLVHFSEYLEEDSEHKYRSIVRNTYKAAQGRYGFIDYNSAHKLSHSLYDLLDKAQDLAAAKNIEESLAICKTLIEEVPIFIQNMDDSSGSAGDIFITALGLLDEIATTAPPLVKDELFTYLIVESEKEKYYDFGFGDYFLNLLPGLITTTEQEEAFFKMIEERMKVIKKRPYAEYSLNQLLQLKAIYLADSGQDEEALAIIEANKDYPEFRRMLIDQAITSNNIEQAKALCKEGIKLSKEKGNPGTTHEWERMLLEFAIMQKDVPEIRKQAETLFFNGHFDMQYYKIIKDTHKKEDWPEHCEVIINRIKGIRVYGNYRQADSLADIFIEEKYWERLLKLVELNSSQLRFVDEFAEYLKDDHPTEVLTFYENGIKTLATQAGRNIYNDIAKHLKKMKKIEGGDIIVADIISYFRTQYKNRPAMMEIMDKISS
ncbi:MAG: SWIM zinc finger family protein [Balneolaceae bacterium]